MIRQGEGPLVPAFTKPLGILGIEGIYDLVALRDNHVDEPYYQQMVENVFGTDEVSLYAHDIGGLQLVTLPRG